MIREMKPSDWTSVRKIYLQGIESGVVTFTTVCPSFEEWDNDHIKESRFVYEDDKILGFAVLAPTSKKEAYKGVAELSIYVDENAKRKGIGTKLFAAIKKRAEELGYWTIYSAIFAINEDSINFHKKMGFREIGYRERIAKDKFGNWQNTVLMEMRL